MQTAAPQVGTSRTEMQEVVPSLPHQVPEPTITSVPIQQYVEMLEKSSAQWSAAWTFAGTVAAFVGVVIGVGAIIVAYTLWRQSKEWREVAEKKLQEAHARHEAVISAFAAEHNSLLTRHEELVRSFIENEQAKLESIVKRLPKPTDTAEKERLEEIEGEMREIRSYVQRALELTNSPVVSGTSVGGVGTLQLRQTPLVNSVIARLEREGYPTLQLKDFPSSSASVIASALQTEAERRVKEARKKGEKDG